VYDKEGVPRGDEFLRRWGVLFEDGDMSLKDFLRQLNWACGGDIAVDNLPETKDMAAWFQSELTRLGHPMRHVKRCHDVKPMEF